MLVWIEGACDWEPNRRAGYDYELLPPETAIDPSEDKVSIEATYAMRASFAGGELARACEGSDTVRTCRLSTVPAVTGSLGSVPVRAQRGVTQGVPVDFPAPGQ